MTIGLTRSLRERVVETLEEFKRQAWRDPWDTSVVSQVIGPSSRTSGLAVFTLIADGFTFETPVLPGDDLAEFFGLPAVH